MPLWESSVIAQMGLVLIALPLISTNQISSITTTPPSPTFTSFDNLFSFSMKYPASLLMAPKAKSG